MPVRSSIWISGAVGFVLGVALRSFVGLPFAPSQNVKKALPPEVSTAPAGPRLRAAIETLAEATRRVQGTIADGGKPACMQSASSEFETLRLALSEAERELRDERATRQQLEGKPIQFPAGAKRPREADLAAGLERAFKTGKVPATIKEIDCSEYPCIAFAETPATPKLSDGDFQTMVGDLFESITAAEIARKASFRFRPEPVSLGDSTAAKRTVFAVGLAGEKVDASDDEVRQRVDARIQQYFNSLPGAP